jgi:hypothetical protein
MVSKERLRSIALGTVIAYTSGAFLSVVVAHILQIAVPGSGLGERIILPVAKGMEFLDSHWKAALIVLLPFVTPIVRDLLPRVRKIGSLELEAVDLEPEGVREKPAQAEGDEQ